MDSVDVASGGPLRGRGLRFVLVGELMAHRQRTVAQLAAAVQGYGFELSGRASKVGSPPPHPQARPATTRGSLHAQPPARLSGRSGSGPGNGPNPCPAPHHPAPRHWARHSTRLSLRPEPSTRNPGPPHGTTSTGSGPANEPPNQRPGQTQSPRFSLVDPGYDADGARWSRMT